MQVGLRSRSHIGHICKKAPQVFRTNVNRELIYRILLCEPSRSTQRIEAKDAVPAVTRYLLHTCLRSTHTTTNATGHPSRPSTEYPPFKLLFTTSSKDSVPQRPQRVVCPNIATSIPLFSSCVVDQFRTQVLLSCSTD